MGGAGERKQEFADKALKIKSGAGGWGNLVRLGGPHSCVKISRLLIHLGRTIARRVSRGLQVPDDPRQWSDEDIVVFLQAEGEDLPGTQIAGDLCLRRALGKVMTAETEWETRYPELAAHVTDGLPGTSAGGEQPKFLTSLWGPETMRRDVLVKFCPPMDQATGRRRADLLLEACRI